MVGEQSEPFRQPRLQVGGCEQSFRRVWACVVGESPRKRSVELREVWEVVRVRCGWVAEWVSLLSQLLPPPLPRPAVPCPAAVITCPCLSPPSRTTLP